MAGHLTEKRERFCRLYIELAHAGRAYREAYGSKSSDKTCYEAASKLMSEQCVKDRIQELRDKHAEAQGVTIEAIAKQLDDDRNLAYETRNASAACKASVEKGKLYGLFVDKKDITLGMRPDDARQIIKALLPKMLPKVQE